MMDIRYQIRQTKAALTWSVKVLHQGPNLEAFSDPIAKVHTLYFPCHGEAPPLGVLRALGQAMLAETVHPVFGGATIENSGHDRGILASAFRECSAWFIDAWLMAIAPEMSGLVLALNLASDRARYDLFQSARLVAGGIRWKDFDLEIGHRKLVRAFLAIPPDQPSLAAYTELVNSLIEPARLQARITPEQTWVISRSSPWDLHPGTNANFRPMEEG